MKLPNYRARRYAYRVTAAVLAYLGVKGLVSGQEADAILLLASAVLEVADYKASDAPDEPSAGH